MDLRHGRRDGGDARGNADRDREHVVDQKRSGCNQPRRLAKIVVCDDVRAGATGVGLNRLHLGEGDERQQQCATCSDRQTVGQRA